MDRPRGPKLLWSPLRKMAKRIRPFQGFTTPMCFPALYLGSFLLIIVYRGASRRTRWDRNRSSRVPLLVAAGRNPLGSEHRRETSSGATLKFIETADSYRDVPSWIIENAGRADESSLYPDFRLEELRRDLIAIKINLRLCEQLRPEFTARKIGIISAESRRSSFLIILLLSFFPLPIFYSIFFKYSIFFFE